MFNNTKNHMTKREHIRLLRVGNKTDSFAAEVY
jgi:hypothetical protein